LPKQKPPEAGRRAPARPPWLTAEDAERGVGFWPPLNEEGADAHDRLPRAGNTPAEDNDPVRGGGRERDAGSQPHGRHRLEQERFEISPALIHGQPIISMQQQLNQSSRSDVTSEHERKSQAADVLSRWNWREAKKVEAEPTKSGDGRHDRSFTVAPTVSGGDEAQIAQVGQPDHLPGDLGRNREPSPVLDEDGRGFLGPEADSRSCGFTPYGSTNAGEQSVMPQRVVDLSAPEAEAAMGGSSDIDGVEPGAARESAEGIPENADVEPAQPGLLSRRADAKERDFVPEMAPAEEVPEASRKSLPNINRFDAASGRRIALPPWKVPAFGMSTELGYATSDSREPPIGRPAVARVDNATGESAASPQRSRNPLAGPLLPPPPPLPGWPPGVPLPTGWGFSSAPPGWPPVPQRVPPPPFWPLPSGEGVQSPPALPRTPQAPPDFLPAQVFRMSPSLDEAKVVNRRRYTPRSGWRRVVHRVTGGHVNPGDSRKDLAQEHLLCLIRQPIAGDFRVAVLSIKGGVGKTTTTLGLGSAFAMVRRDRVIAVDANPDRGTLAERVRDVSTSSTVRDLLTDPNLNRYGDVRGHTKMAVSRLEVLASEQDPAAAEVFGEADYRRTVDILGQYYNVILTDCGTGIMHSAMAGVLDLAHSIVLVSSPAMDAVRSASATLDWLRQHGHSGLVREACVVLSASRPGSAALKMDKVFEFFEARCRSIHIIPFDPHLAEGADVDFGMLKPATSQAYLELAGVVAENFPRLRGPRERP
jgi:MinD-like ATPase involved in chromosome partitioning or flagellar assembly